MSHASPLIEQDIEGYLAQHESKELLRFLTCGNVDDGKSTLIGRLLHDSKMIYEDQLSAVSRDSVKMGTTGGDIDLALLVDGLQAEREQGITIDVAYRYFSTARRKFIIADTPGHEQYTRNMATGASTCDLAIILVDARYGVQTQTRRHSFIVSLLGIRHVVVAINKMDLMDYSESVFNGIQADFLAFAENLSIPDVRFIPMSALKGDNVVNPSEHMPWYQGLPLLELLDTMTIARDSHMDQARFPVQYVNRPHLDFRGYSGTMASGIFRKGDDIMVLPSRKTSRIRAIVTQDGELDQVTSMQAVTLTLEHEIDVSRGDFLVHQGDQDQLPHVEDRFRAHVVWMTEAPLVPGRHYYLKQATRTVNAHVALIHHRIDVNTLEHHQAERLQLNEIALCELQLNAPIVFDAYSRCKQTGSFIIIDRLSNVTVGAGMIVGPAQTTMQGARVSAEERISRYSHKPVTLCHAGQNRREWAIALERRLFDLGHACVYLEGDGASVDLVRGAALLNHAGVLVMTDLDYQTLGEGGRHVEMPASLLEVDEQIQWLLKEGILTH